MAGVLQGEIVKRSFDFMVSLLAIAILWPFIAVIALLIRINLGSPVLFRQQRPGLNAKPFHIYKFRTMLLTRDMQGELLPDQERMTTFGSFLRRFSLDELPQLFNVLIGSLSLVGPRPLLMEYLPLYNAEQARRHLVKPGITGWAQVNGRNAISWEDKFNYDVWYVEHQSFCLDMKILQMTVQKVLRSEGINQIGNVTMEKFQGQSNHQQEQQ
jgi:sugar transferase EpsL